MKDQFYRSVVYNSPMAYSYHRMIMNDLGVPIDYKFLDVNPAFEKMTGLHASLVIGRNVTEVYPGIQASKFDWIACYGRVAVQGEPLEFDQYLEHNDTWYRVYAYSPEIGYFITLFSSISREIFERNKAQDLLRASEEKYRTLIESFNSAIAIVNRVGKILYINYTGADLLGTGRPEEIIGKRLTDLFPEEAAERQMSYIEQALCSGQSVTYEALSTPMGRERWVRASVQPIVNNQFESDSEIVLINTLDITDQKNTEDAL